MFWDEMIMMKYNVDVDILLEYELVISIFFIST
jgi:hypothetical protein